VSSGSRPRLLGEVGSGTTMCPTVPDGSWDTSIKKSLAGLPVQLGINVPNACSHVSKVPDIRAIMGLQDIRAYNIFNACKTCG
jgi:hypothetical protein